MHPKAVLAVVTIILHFAVLIDGRRVRDKAAYVRVVECWKAGSLVSQEIATRPGTINYKELYCKHYETVDTCLLEPFDYDAHPSRVLYFFQAYQWQMAILQTNFLKSCTNLDLDAMKELVLNSTIMRREGLNSIENDCFTPCAQKLLGKCGARAAQAWGQQMDDLAALQSSVTCYKEEVKNCKAPFWKHLTRFYHVFDKHLKKHNSLLEKMLNNTLYQ